MGAIYKIINVVNDHFYVGSAVKEKRRKWEHWTDLKKGVHHCQRLQEAWCEFGEDAFEFMVVEQVADERLLEIEDIYLGINAGQSHCYNTALSTRTSAATQLGVREKISSTLTKIYTANPQKHPRYGKTHTEETKAKISASRVGKMAGSRHYRYGQKVSQEVRDKIGATQRGVSKAPRVYTEDGLRKKRESMSRNRRPSSPLPWGLVFEKFPQEVKDKYDFSKAVYTGALNRITGVICPKHGEISNYAAQFRKGAGCGLCGAEVRAKKTSVRVKQEWSTEEGRHKFMQRTSRKSLTHLLKTAKKCLPQD